MRHAIWGTLVLLAAPASAQEAGFGEVHFVGDTSVHLVTRFFGSGGRVEVRVGEARETVSLHEGAPAQASAAGGARGLLVALTGALTGASDTVEASFVPTAGGRAGPPRRHALRRIAGAARVPVGAVVAARPDGFALFWQEASTSNPRVPYETYLARFDLDGAAVGDTQRVLAPWPLADVVWRAERDQYFFLLYYGGDPRGTRLCGVHVDPRALRNVEHPFWSSRPGRIEEARLVTREGRVVAVYRDDGELLERDVSEGAWGRDPPASRSRGPIAPSEGYGLRASAEGVAIHRAPLER